MEVIKRYTGIGGGIQIPKMLVIHSMAEYVETDGSYKDIPEGVYSAHEWLQLDGTSCHFLLHPNGDFTKQRSTKEICWHAKDFNTGSVGIEVLLSGVHNYASFLSEIKKDYATPKQYESLIELSNNIIEYFDIDKVVRHSDLSPGRKFDPGDGFKWEYFKSKLV